MLPISRTFHGFLQPTGRILLLIIALGFALSGRGQTEAMVRPPFPQLEAVAPECRVLANTILTAVLEREGLYTVFGGLKPMSSVTVGGYGDRPGESATALMQRYDNAAAALCDDDLIFRMAYWNERAPRVAQVFVFRHSLVREKVREHAAIFAAENIEPGTPIRTIVERVMNYHFQDADRVTGLFYGFPEHAVDFFCHPQKYGPVNTLRRLDSDRSGVRIETHQRGSAFVYVLPMQGEYTTADVDLMFAAQPILAEFRRRRALHTNESGALDAVALARQWISNSMAGLPGAGLRADRSAPSASAPTSGTRAWMRSWTGSWVSAKPGVGLMAAIADDGEADSLRFEFTVGGSQYFRFRLEQDPAGEGVRLVPVTSSNSFYEESSFVIERSDGDQWRMRSRYNQRYRDERERARKAGNPANPAAAVPSGGYDWGAFKRAPSVREAMARGRSEHWARPLPVAQPTGTARPVTTLSRPETEPIVFDSRWHEFGLYLREFSASVRHQMFKHLLEGKVKPPRFTACEVQFTLHAKGEVSQVKPRGQVYGSRALEIARGALGGVHRPWTPEMVDLLGDDQIMTFRFYFDY